MVLLGMGLFDRAEGEAKSIKLLFRPPDAGLAVMSIKTLHCMIRGNQELSRTVGVDEICSPFDVRGSKAKIVLAT